MAASPRPYLTRQEVLAAVDLPTHTLSYWQSQIAWIRPARTASGQRRWSRDDVDLLRDVRRLIRDEGHTIHGSLKVIRARGIETVKALGRGEAVVEVAGASVDRPETDPHAALLANLPPGVADLPEPARVALLRTLSDPVAALALAQDVMRADSRDQFSEAA